MITTTIRQATYEDLTQWLVNHTGRELTAQTFLDGTPVNMTVKLCNYKTEVNTVSIDIYQGRSYLSAHNRLTISNCNLDTVTEYNDSAIGKYYSLKYKDGGKLTFFILD